jgi:DtxR family transcriptional regulator, Mn-dependent transcriptional regulator
MMMTLFGDWLVVLGAVALLLLGFWPRIGLVARWQAARLLADRSQREDALKHLLHMEANQHSPSLESLAGALQIPTSNAAELIGSLEAHGMVSHIAGALRLEPAGRELALHVIRAHRLWESYLAEQTGVSEEEWHRLAERKEHQLTPEDAETLARRLCNPLRDPHGDAIPAADGALEADAGQSLNAAEPGVPLMISHLEDEPEAVFAQLVALGLQPGMRILVTEKSPQRISFRVDGKEQVLAPVLAENISVAPVPETAGMDLRETWRLAQLQPGQRAQVIELAPSCRGQERRRLLDLGFVPGTEVRVDVVSPSGDPTAYRVRGASIALRQSQASHIRIGMPEAVSA